jgi:hypothetical protein
LVVVVLVGQHQLLQALMVVAAVLAVVAVARVKMEPLVVVAVMAQYLFGLGKKLTR